VGSSSRAPDFAATEMIRPLDRGLKRWKKLSFFESASVSAGSAVKVNFRRP